MKRILLASYIEIFLVALLNFNPIFNIISDVKPVLEFFDYALPAMLFLEVIYCTLTSRSILVDIIYAFTYKARVINIHSYHENILNTEKKNADPLAIFENHANRSRETLKSAQRRPNALIMIGAVIAIFGLIFFVVTLPDFVNPLSGDETSNLPGTADIMYLLPRLLMLVFIQLLAGFFLRQYRTSMEEVRYYESVLRDRENQMLAFIASEKMDEEVRKSMVECLMASGGKDIMKLQQGESTITIETYRNDENEFKGPIDKFLDAFKSVKQ